MQSSSLDETNLASRSDQLRSIIENIVIIVYYRNESHNIYIYILYTLYIYGVHSIYIYVQVAACIGLRRLVVDGPRSAPRMCAQVS